jgi:hypothetical protein
VAWISRKVRSQSWRKISGERVEAWRSWRIEDLSTSQVLDEEGEAMLAVYGLTPICVIDLRAKFYT